MLYSLARLVLAPLLRLIYRPVIRGRDNVPRRGPVILASNHLSFIDSIVIALLAPRPVHFLAKNEYFTGRVSKAPSHAASSPPSGASPLTAEHTAARRHRWTQPSRS
ncbi:lysophospholipid acyltransferase family protein [Streptomyces sp. NPDC093984]|uniref:lysophospholipid acyltransferase family protein n=1 Tax=Streptomyces sp. NPDC093984 TaxID=3366052 RepID=UPI0038089AEC